MQFEGMLEDGDEEVDLLIYMVIDIVEDKVVFDGNYLLVGMVLCFVLIVKDVCEVIEDEIEYEYVYGVEGFEIIDEDDDEDGEVLLGCILY